MTVDQKHQLRLLPSIDELLQSAAGQRLISLYSRTVTLHAIRTTLAQARADIRHGAACPAPEVLLVRAEHLLQPA